MGDDDLRFGDLGGGGGGSGIQGIIDLAINLTILAIVLFMCYKVIVALIPLL